LYANVCHNSQDFPPVPPGGQGAWMQPKSYDSAGTLSNPSRNPYWNVALWQGTNTYLVGSGSRRLLIDAGEKNVPEYSQNLRQVLKTENCSLKDLVVTHWHHDHIGGVSDVMKMAGEGVTVHKFPREINDVIEGVEIAKLEDGQEISVEGANFQVLHTPGHTTDHVVLYLKEENAVFSADCILGEGTAVFESLYHYMQSLEKILKIQPSVIYPGHGPVIQDPVEKIKFYIQHRLAREQQIISCLESSGQVGLESMEIVKTVYKETPTNLHMAANVNVNHHLEKLETEGKVTKDGQTWKVAL